MRILSIATTLAATAVFAITLAAQSLDVQLQRAEQKEMATGDLEAAINDYKRIADRSGSDRGIAARALLRMAEAHQKLGEAEARKIYQQIVRDYPDQEVTLSTARARLNEIATGVVVRLVWNPPAGVRVNRVSPNGQYVAYADASSLMIRDLATGTQQPVIKFASGQAGPTLAWSPDSRRIAFEFHEAGTQFRTINVDGSDMRTVLSNGGAWARVLDYFPDGKRLLASKAQGNDSLVFAINVTDGSVQELVLRPGPGGSGWPRLSPDGRHVALRNSPGLSLLATDGSGETILSRNASDLNAAAWSPEGNSVFFIRNQDGRLDLWAAPIAKGKLNGEPSLVLRDFGSGRVIENQVTRDGSLYYVKPGMIQGATELHKLEKVLEFGGAAAKVQDQSVAGAIRWAAEFPDNKETTLALSVRGTRVTGTITHAGDTAGPPTVAIYDGKIDGNTISFKAHSPGGDRTITLTGKINGDEIHFTREIQISEGADPGGRGIYGAGGPATFTARRIK